MRKIDSQLIHLICFPLLVTSLTLCIGQNKGGSIAGNGALEKSIQRYLIEASPGIEGRPTKYSFALVDLNGDGTKEAIVYVVDQDWCGTAGCTLLIMVREMTGYHVIGKIPAVRLPVSVLATKSNGWHDIGITIRPNGFEPHYRARISFDGATFPISSVEKLTKEIPARVVISEKSTRRLLFPQ